MELFKKEINRTIPIPLYYQLKTLIKDDIENGSLKIGDAIPTETDIASHYQLSRSTVRQALSELVKEGFLIRKASKGTFVTEPQKTSSPIRSFEPFYQQIQRGGGIPKTELLDLKVIDPPEKLKIKMKLGEKEKVISLFRRRFADNIPTVTIQNFMPYQLCSFILSYNFYENSLYELLMSKPESTIKTTTTIISSELATPEDAALLEIKTGSPMLCFHNRSVSADGHIIDYAFARYRGDTQTFEFEASPR